MDPWTEYAVTDFEGLSLSFGDAELDVRVERGELIVHVVRPKARAGPWGAVDREERWAAPGPAVSFDLVPALPDRVVVVRALNPFRMAPGTDLGLFVQLPLWAQVRLPDADRTLVAEIEALRLSPTWWGDKTRGEQGYFLETRVEHTDPEHTDPHAPWALCPLRVSNRSHRTLDVDRLAIWAPHLSLFETPAGLWADETRVVYTGDQATQLDVSGKPPDSCPTQPTRYPPRRPLPKGLRAMTFAHLRSLEWY